MPENAPGSTGSPVSQSGNVSTARANQNPSSANLSASGRSTVFGLNYDGSVDTQDNGTGFFTDPSTGKPYDTRNPNLVGFSLPISVVNGSIGNRWDPQVQAAISSGKYKVRVTSPNGKTVTGPMVDTGPAAWTGNAIDTTKGAADALGIKDNSRLTYSIIGPDGKTVPIQGNNADPDAPIASAGGKGNGLTRSYYANLAMQRWNVEHSPFNFGMRVATPDELDKYEAYLNSGGDPAAISTQDKLGYALAQDPKYLLSDEAYPIWKELIRDPQKAKSLGQQVSEGINSIPGMISETGKDLGAFFQNAASTVSNSSQYYWDNLTGQEKGLTLTQDLANNLATNVAGSADGVKGIVDMVDGISTFTHNMINSGVNLAQGKPIDDDDNARAEFQLMQRTAARADWAKQAVNVVAAGYSAAGQSDLAKDVQSAAINPQAAAGASLVLQTLAPIPVLDGAGALLKGLIRPSFVASTVDALGNASKAEAVFQNASKDLMAAKSAMASASTPEEFNAAKAVHDAATDAFNSAQQAYQSANVDANTAMSNFAKTVNPGNTSTVAGAGAKALSAGLDTAAKLAKGVADFPGKIASRISGGNPAIQSFAEKMVDKAVDWTLYSHTGPVGPIIKGVMQNAPTIGDAVSAPLRVMGKELLSAESSLPFFRRVSQELGSDSATGKIASWLDTPAIYALGDISKAGGAAAKGAVSGAILGGMSNPLNPIQSAIQGSAFGGVYGLAGAGMGQWRKFNDAAESLRASYGDLSRFKQNKLLPSQQADFDKLSLPDQIKLSQISSAHPDVGINFYNNPGGESGFHNVDYATGKSVANINTAGQNPLAPMLAHEVQHYMARSGQYQQVYDAVLGNADTEKVGAYTSLDPQGNPIKTPDGGYQLTPEFYDHKQAYTDKLAAIGENPNISDKDFAQEIYAEHGVDYLMSGSHLSNGSFKPGLWTSSASQELLGKLGYTFNRSGQVVGTGLFSGLKQEDSLSNIVKGYYKLKNGWKVNPEDIKAPGVVTKAEVQSDPTILAKKLRGSAAIATDDQGNITGLKSNGQRDQEARALSTFIYDSLSKESPQWLQQNGISFNPESKAFEARSLPEQLLNDALDHVNASSHYRDQVHSINRGLADPNNQGGVLGFGYFKATNFGRYGSFPFENREAIPYQMHILRNDNLLVKTADMAQIMKNYSMIRDRPDIKGTWSNLSSFARDVDQYFTNLSKGDPGASNGIGEAKRDKINMLLGLKANKLNQANNPLSGTGAAKDKPFIKSFRLDRMANVNWNGSINSFKTQADYDLANRNYNPAKIQQLGLGDSPTAKAIAERAVRYDESGKEAMLVSAVKDLRTGETVSSEFGHVLALRKLLGRTPSTEKPSWTSVPGGLEREEEGRKPDYVEYGYLTNKGRFVTSPMDLARLQEED